MANKRDTFLERYPFICPVCGNESEAAPSIFMTGFEINIGRGVCKCGTSLHLEIEPDMFGDRMKAVIEDDYIKKLKIEMKKENNQNDQ